MHVARLVRSSLSVVLLLTAASIAQTTRPIAPVDFTKETLPNGLRVVYVPVKDTPVVDVRVFYHVGSRDERPDRQGFAHMFEHMMFRGSAHVAPEEHMKLINVVGGYCNANTRFDRTTYIDTVPANQIELALYLEADRMASFKVTDDTFKIERDVVAKEWGIGKNRPYGTQWEDFLGAAFSTHSYRWSVIGNMEHLRNAAVSELQAFFNKYYVPNNAVLTITGNFDQAAAQAMVHKYYAWIPAGPAIDRGIPAEPEQTEPKLSTVQRVVPLPAVMIGYKLPAFNSPDHPALYLLGSILGDGDSSRLDRKLVNNADPYCTSVGAGPMALQDAGLFFLQGSVMQGKNAETVKDLLLDSVTEVLAKGVTEEELAKAKLVAKKAIVAGRAEADELGDQVGEEELMGGDAGRINTTVDQLFAVTTEDVSRVAKKYLNTSNSTTLITMPDPLGAKARAAAAEEEKKIKSAPVATTNEVVEPRAVTFPKDYPLKPPVASAAASPVFKKGEEFNINGVKVIVMEDHRLPIVTWGLTFRRGSYANPAGKEGLGSIATEMMSRGAAGLTFEQISEDLDSRAISIDISDGGDITRVNGSAITDQFEHGMTRTAEILTKPTFDKDEFAKLVDQTVNQLAVSLETPGVVIGREISSAIYGTTPLGRSATPESVKALTLEDVKAYYASTFKPQDAVFLIAGDVTVARGKELAAKLIESLQAADTTDTQVAAIDYTAPKYGRKILLIDNPAGKQSSLRMAIPAYDIRSEDKFPGLLAGQILSSGIESRLNKYVRAEKGYSYGVGAYFRADRHSGLFTGSTETAFATTGPCIEAMFKVFEDMRREPVTATELSEAKSRVAGSMLMETQTIQQQAGRRVDAILNDYPIDYWDKLPARVAEVTAQQIQDVMNKYVKDGDMTIVVVAPADQVKEQLEKLGTVEVLPMPSKRGEATTRPSGELLK